MHSVTQLPVAPEDYSGKNLRKVSFKGKNLMHARFQDSDLRGADFTDADLRGADLTHVRTGISPTNVTAIFVFALLVSLLSGYIATIAGITVNEMLVSTDKKIKIAGYITVVLILVFIGLSIWRGVGNAIYKLALPVALLAIVLGIVAYATGAGTGKGMFFLVLALVLVVCMFIVGTIARSVAGTLSAILMTVVALAGGAFGKSVGGGIGTVIMAISCVVISKRALSGAKGFEGLRRIAYWVTQKFGTSFRHSRLTDANFTRARIQNADFSQADIAEVKWGGAKKVNCVL